MKGLLLGLICFIAVLGCAAKLSGKDAISTITNERGFPKLISHEALINKNNPIFHEINRLVSEGYAVKTSKWINFVGYKNYKYQITDKEKQVLDSLRWRTTGEREVHFWTHERSIRSIREIVFDNDEKNFAYVTAILQDKLTKKFMIMTDKSFGKDYDLEKRGKGWQDHTQRMFPTLK